MDEATGPVRAEDAGGGVVRVTLQRPPALTDRPDLRAAITGGRLLGAVLPAERAKLHRERWVGRAPAADTVAARQANAQQPSGEGVEVEKRELAVLVDRDDGREGVRAFLEKRPARFGSRRERAS